MTRDRRTAVVGVAESDLGVTERSSFQLHAQSVQRSLEDAGLTLQDVDGFATAGAARFSASAVCEYLGLRPSWMESTFEGGSSFVLHLNRATEAIGAGVCDVVVVSYGSNQRSAATRELGGVVHSHTPEAQFEDPYGPLNPISMYALAAQRHMYEFGTTPEQLAEVAVAARSWALLNPAAYCFERGPLTVKDVVESPMVSSPLHRHDCCLVTDGGGAVVLTSMEQARDLRKTPVVVLGYGETSTNVGMSQISDLTTTGAVFSGQKAFAAAHRQPSDIDLAQVYDSFTITVLLSLEALGFCKPGEGGDFVSGGRIAPGGSFPLNTSGGGLSYGHPGMFGIFLIVEAVRQLRNEAGTRQVPDVATALIHGTGGCFSSHATAILGVEG